ncbi:MAG: aldolase/citrate lyase family protein [Chloroflexota bacterium]|nr:aldolase/citrate lyase family protein [Chloroflexota bacterium]
MEIRKNRIKQRLKDGKHVIAIENLNDPDLVEQFAPNDPHCFWFEGEHSIVNPQNIGDLTRAADLINATSIVRVPRPEYQLIYHALDLGAQGVSVPHVKNKQDAELVVNASKFSPLGQRGMFTSRQGIGVEDYFKKANEETFVLVFIEDLIAIENLDEILEVDNIDVFFVGPGDLSQELGHIGEQNHPKVDKVVQETINRITKKGRVAGTVANINSYEWAMQTGARFFLSGALDWIGKGFNEFNELAEKL